MAKIAPTGISAAKVPIIARRVGRAELTEFLVAANRKHPPRLRLSPVGQSPNHRRAEKDGTIRSEEHTSELQSLMRISYAVFCLKKKTQIKKIQNTNIRENHT